MVRWRWRGCGLWPFESRSSAVLAWPSEAASISAVRPSLSLTSISAPCFSSISTTWEGCKLKRQALKKTDLVQLRYSHRETCHLCVSVFGGTKQRDHSPSVGYLQARLPLQQESTHLYPASAWCCAQCWQRVGIEMRWWSGDKYIIDIFRRKAEKEVTCREEQNEWAYCCFKLRFWMLKLNIWIICFFWLELTKKSQISLI